MLTLLHTADWHLGKRLYGQPMEEEQNMFLEWILAYIQSEKIDVLLVSGDVFDLANPPAPVISRFYRFLADLTCTNCRAIFTGGNHDHPEVINAASPLLANQGIHLVGNMPENYSDCLIPLNEQWIVAAVPFLRDRDIRNAIAGQSYSDRIAQVRAGIKEAYLNVAKSSTNRFPNHKIIAMGHLFTAGVSLSESEREIQVGNLGQFDAADFPKTFEYVALGHIHKPQQVDAEGKVIYSGSPYPLSFSEQDPKRVIKLELIDATYSKTSVSVPLFRPLLRFKGTLEEIKEQWNASSIESSPLKPRAEIVVEEEHINPLRIRQTEDWVREQNSDENSIATILQSRVQFTGQKNQVHAEHLLTARPELQPESIFSKILEGLSVQSEEAAQLKETFGELLETYNNPAS
jgi:DNA repair protein SbcD/Mre11